MHSYQYLYGHDDKRGKKHQASAYREKPPQILQLNKDNSWFYKILYKLWTIWQAENESKLDSFPKDFYKHPFIRYYVLNVDLYLNMQNQV